FVRIHEFTEELNNDLFEKFDEIAELIKMRNEKPLARVEDYLKNTTIQELDKDKFTADEVLQILKDDYTKLKNLAIDIRNTADDEGDFEVVAILEGHVAGYSKNLWFIDAMLS
ncbi:MAG: DNA starvation/stationary phase protection protein, partial [Halanaerobiaceae bacterium]|nr:DNA starvation/stationary phase protection protein [Halanaerobiaceae bacterium]